MFVVYVLCAGDDMIVVRRLDLTRTHARCCGVAYVCTCAEPCPVEFEQVKGFGELGAKCNDKQTMKECCELFKKIACPYNHLLNDITNVCANEFFYLIHTKGKLQPGTILENCNEGPMGINC